MLKIAICDDESDIRKKVKDLTEIYLSNKGYKFVIDTFCDGEELLKSKNDYSIIFLDIDMKKTDGLTSAKKIREENKITKIVFITNHPEFIKQALLVRAFAYLDKPIHQNEFETTLREAIIYYQDMTSSINYKIHTTIGDILIDLNKVLYFEFVDRKIKIMTVNQILYTYSTIKKLSKNLEQYSFYSPHKAFLVNLKYVLNASGNNVILTNNEVLPLSQKKATKFKSSLIDYINQNTIRGLK